MDNLRQPPQLSFALDGPALRYCVECGGVIRRIRDDSANIYCTRRCYDAARHAKRTVGTPCTIEACDLPIIAFGLCSKHYTRLRSHGTPEPSLDTIVPLPINSGSAGWLAGILDGEGHLGIHKRTHPTYCAYRLVISVVNTDRAMIDRILDLTKMGRVYFRDRQANRRRQWVWFVESTVRMKALLVTVRPYMVTRAGQADVILAFPSRHQKCPAYKERLYQDIRKRNLRGAHNHPEDSLDAV